MKKLLFIIVLFFANSLLAQEEALVTICAPDGKGAEIVFTTSSNSNTWGPTKVTNPGDPVIWETYGSIVIPPSGYPGDTYPTWDFSNNLGNVEVSLSGVQNVTDLRFNTTDITDFSINAELPNLEVFEVKIMPNLTSANVSNLTGVKILVLRDNNLSVLDISANTALEELYVYGNHLTELDISNSPLLSTVNATGNNLTQAQINTIILNLDAAGVTNGTLRLANNNGSPSDIVYDAYQNLVSKGWDIDIAGPAPPTNTGDPTAMDNFRIENSFPDRVYFDTALSIDGIDYTKFIIYNKTITGVNTTDNYFTVDSPFNFWDNKLIRLEDGDGIVKDFTVREIQNNIVEPSASDHTYYVNSAVGSSGNGLSEGAAFKTLDEAFSAVEAQGTPEGSTIWIKAGDYSGTATLTASGTAAKPIKIIGYQNTIGDNPSMTRSHNMVFNSSILPLFEGNNTTPHAITCEEEQYIILRNLSFQNYTNNVFDAYDSTYSIVDNMYNSGGFYFWQVIDPNSTNNRVLNSFFRDETSGGIRLQNKENFVDNIWSISTKVVNKDYYISIYGGTDDFQGNIVMRSYLHRYGQDSHTGHGVSIKAGDTEANGFRHRYNLVEDLDIWNMKNGSVEFRHSAVKYSVVRNVRALVDYSDYYGESYNGFTFQNGASFNFIEDSYVKGHRNSIYFLESDEDPTDTEGGSDNTITNTVFDDVMYILRATSSTGVNLTNKRNKFINCTFKDVVWFNVDLVPDVVGWDNTNSIVNSIFLNVASESNGGGDQPIVYNDNLFWNSWGVEAGTGNFSFDPALDVNYIPTANFADISVPRVDGVHYDLNSKYRANPTTVGAVSAIDEIAVTGDIPILENFTVTASNPDRVLFTSTGDVTGLTKDDFYVTGNTVSSITVDGDGLGGYFTLGTPLTFWSNNTIRLGNIGVPVNNGIIRDFELQYIENTIPEPSANTNRYVTTTGGSGAGTEGDPWSLSYALANAEPGQTVWIKAGTYSGTYTCTVDGNSSSPIKFVGYDNTIGDSPQIEKSVDVVVDPTTFPVISTTYMNGKAFNTDHTDYVIFRNIQVTGGEYAWSWRSTNYVLFDNVLGTEAHAGAHGLNTTIDAPIEVTWLNSVFTNSTGWGIVGSGERVRIDGCVAGSNRQIVMDYQISMNGSNMPETGGHIIRNCRAENNYADIHAGNHGITVYGSTSYVGQTQKTQKHTLVEKSEVIDCRQSLENRRSGVSHTVWRDIEVWETGDLRGMQGIKINLSSYSVFDNIRVRHGESAIVWYGTSEDWSTTAYAAGHHNIIKNCTFEDMYYAFNHNGDGTPPSGYDIRMPQNERVINCTFKDISRNFFQKASIVTNETGFDNIIQNSIIINTDDESDSGSNSWTFENNVTWDVWVGNGNSITGTDNISYNPQLDGSLAPQGDFSELSVPRIEGVYYDMNSVERKETTTAGAITHPNESIVAVPITTNPILSNFRIEDNQRSRIYFDSSTPITGSTAADFILWETTTFTGIYINPNNTSGHYLTTATPLNIFSNPLVEYDGSSISNSFGPLLRMRLQRVTNNIAEPTPLVNYYVDASVSSSGNGLSEGSAFKTIQEGIDVLSAGDKLWIKAGIYTGTSLAGSTQDGTLENPIQIEGYKNTPGDGPELTRTINMSFDQNELPLINGASDGIDIDNSHYVIVKNLQFEGHLSDGLGLDNSSFAVVKNIYSSGGESGITVNNDTGGLNGSFGHIRIERSFFRNGTGRGTRLQGRNCSHIDVWAVSTYDVGMDYYLSVYGNSMDSNSYNTGSSFLDCYIYRYDADSHGGHGISIKTGSVAEDMRLSNGLVENCELVNTGQGVELRHANTFEWVVRDNVGSATTTSDGNLITFRDGTHDNWVQDNIMNGGYIAIRFTENDGENGIDPGGVDNTVINFISNNATYHIETNDGWGDPGGQALPSTGNKIINSTFYGGLYLMAAGVDYGNTNEFINCIFKNIPNRKFNSKLFDPVFSYSTFHGGWGTESGTGNISIDPAFINITEFVPTAAGLNSAEVQTDFFYDYYGKKRINYTMGAVEID